MSDEVLAEQIAYYRARAEEYDATAYPDDHRARTRIASVVAGLGIRGDVLELACGTGRWTRELCARASSVTAIDASPEVIKIARRRCGDRARFEVADMLTWQAPRRYDVIFFAFWLSHVPTAQYGSFFAPLHDWLAPGGRVIFVDEPVSAGDREEGRDGEIVTRTLENGSPHRIVKVFLDPLTTVNRLAALGWSAQVTTRGAWLIGQAQPTAVDGRAAPVNY